MVVEDDGGPGGGGGGSDDEAPSVTLLANGSTGTTTIDGNTDVILDWELGNNPDSCEAFGDWSGSKATSSDSENIGTLSVGLHTFSLTCENDEGTAQDDVAVIVEEEEDDNGGGNRGGGGGISGGGYFGGGGGRVLGTSTKELVITNENIDRFSNTSAYVSWDTNRDASRQVMYGTESISDLDVEEQFYGYETQTIEVTDPQKQQHGILVTGLTPGEEYFFRPISRADQDTATGAELELSPGQVAGIQSCRWLNDHLSIDQQNDPIEVAKLEIFLRDIEGFDIELDADYDRETYNAVVAFQERYAEDVLEPWGYTTGTGFTYITTKKKVNEIVCDRSIALTESQQAEIDAFRSTPARDGAGQDTMRRSTRDVATKTVVHEVQGTSTATMIATSGTTSLNGVVASAVSAFAPIAWDETTRCTILFILILLLIYASTTLIVDIMKGSADTENRRYTTLRTLLGYEIGSAIALLGALALHLYCLIVPLLLILTATAIAILWLLNRDDTQKDKTNVKDKTENTTENVFYNSGNHQFDTSSVASTGSVNSDR